MSNPSMLDVLEQLRRSPNESATVEFKSNLSDPKAIGEYISALANSAALEGHTRAWLVWGVEDGTHAVNGTTFDPFSAKGEGNQSLIMWLQQLTSPRADFSFHTVPHPDGKVILLEIHPARSKPIAFHSARFIRIDSHKVKLDDHGDKEARLWEALGVKQDWTGEIVASATLDDLDPDAIDFARARFIEYSATHVDKHHMLYRLQFDNEKLIEDCIEAVKESPPIAKARLQWRKAGLAIGQAGVAAVEQKGASIVSLDETDIALPDILTDLQDRTQLTRRSIQRILTESRRLEDFKRNPQQFIEQTAEAINRCKRLALVDGIKYQRIGDGEYYAQELFQEKELRGYIDNMLMNTEKAVYEHVVYDSDVERNFASELERNEAIKVYAKLPGWFKIPTPLDNYNPDWAVLLVGNDGQERLYFVVETKGSLFSDALRPIEEGKIKCGKAHFLSLAVGESRAEYVVERSVEGLLSRL